MIYNLSLRASCIRNAIRTHAYTQKKFLNAARTRSFYFALRAAFLRKRTTRLSFNLSLPLSMRFIVKTKKKKKLIFPPEFPLKKNFGEKRATFFPSLSRRVTEKKPIKRIFLKKCYQYSLSRFDQYESGFPARSWCSAYVCPTLGASCNGVASLRKATATCHRARRICR